MSKKRRDERAFLAVGRDAIRRGFDDRIYNLAAEIAFYLVIALPAVALAGLGAIGFFVGPETASSARGEILAWANEVFTASFIDRWIAPALERFLSGGEPHILLMGLVGAVWMMSRVIHTTLEVIRIAYDEERPEGSLRQMAVVAGKAVLALTGALVIGVLAVAGPRWIGASGARGIAALGLHLALWIPLVAFAGAYLWWLYGIAPEDGTSRRRWPGAVLGTVLGGIGSVLLWLQAKWFLDGGGILGPLALPLVVMAWAYVLGFVTLLGAEANRAAEDRFDSP